MTTQRIAELEAEVLRLREAMKLIKYETDIHGNNLNRCIKDEAVKAISTPFTPTALNELIEKVEKLTIERCAVEALSALKLNTREMEGYSYFGSNPGVSEDDYDEIEKAIRALPTGQIDLATCCATTPR